MKANKQLGSNVTQLRKKKGFSQENFAALCRVSTRYMSSIETGKANPSFNVLMRITKVLGVESLNFIEPCEDDAEENAP